MKVCQVYLQSLTWVCKFEVCHPFNGLLSDCTNSSNVWWYILLSQGDWIKEGAVVVDCGINVIPGKMENGSIQWIFLMVRCCLYGGMVLHAAKNFLSHGIIWHSLQVKSYSSLLTLLCKSFSLWWSIYFDLVVFTYKMV